MKKCRRCTKPATLHITELQDGLVQELHLCESCAQQYLQNPAPPVQAEEEEDDLSVKLTDLASAEEIDELDQLVCPNCGISFKEFRRQGRLGCPHDYIAFRNELEPLLENIHGETHHCGKTPRRAPKTSRQQYDLIKLRNQLRSAIEQEKYEEAARLRDEIQRLEAELGEQRLD